jgi:general secretion pathway protein L
LKDLLNSDMTTLARHARSGLAWWLAELQGLVPARWVRPAALHAWHRYERGEIVPASAARADTLVLPGALCLSRLLDMPRMGRADIAAMVELDLDRIMPVAPASLVTGVAIAGPSADGAGLSVRVGAMARKEAAALAEALGAAGISPRHIGPLADDGATLAFDLAPAMRAIGLLPPLSQARRFWWIVVAVLALANLGIAILRDRQQADQLLTLVDAQAPALTAVRRIEDRLHENAARIAELDARRRMHQPLQVLVALDAALPANAWIQRLEWNGADVRVAGFAADGVNVATAFKQSQRFATVRANRAETVAEARTGRPFDLTARFAGGPR